MATIEQLAARVFAARDVAHRTHWKTGSYARHVALNEFYDDVIDRVDAVVEVYQGKFGLIGSFDVQTVDTPNIIQYLESESMWIEENRDILANGCTAVGNLLDALIERYRRTLYKLNNLN